MRAASSHHFLQRLTTTSSNHAHRSSINLVSRLCKCDLLEYVLAKTSLDEIEASKWTRKLCSAVGYLHAKNVVHLDVKLENAFIDFDDELKLGDFGLSAFSCPGTKMSKACGSGVYAAPEVLMSKHIGPYCGRAADVWSLGICSFVMVRGRFPFGVDAPIKAIGAHATALKESHETGQLRPSPAPMLRGELQRGAFSAPHLQLLDACLMLIPAARPTVEDITRAPWLNVDSGPSSPPTAYSSSKCNSKEAVSHPLSVHANTSEPRSFEIVSAKPVDTAPKTLLHGSLQNSASGYGRDCRQRSFDQLSPCTSPDTVIMIPEADVSLKVLPPAHGFKRSGKRFKTSPVDIEFKATRAC